MFSFKTAHPQGNDSVQIESRLSLSPGTNAQRQQRAAFSKTCKKTRKTNTLRPRRPHCYRCDDDDDDDDMYEAVRFMLAHTRTLPTAQTDAQQTQKQTHKKKKILCLTSVVFTAIRSNWRDTTRARASTPCSIHPHGFKKQYIALKRTEVGWGGVGGEAR